MKVILPWSQSLKTGAGDSNRRLLGTQRCKETWHLQRNEIKLHQWSTKKWRLMNFLAKNSKSSSQSIGLANKCLQFLSKNKRHIFHFHQELYRTMYSHFCSTTFCHFSGNFIIPSSQNFLSFWQKNCSRCLLQSSRELKFFPLRESCKDRNKWKSEGAVSGEYGGWIRISQPSCNSFCLVLRYLDGRLCIFCWLILDAFHQVLLSVGLTGSGTCWN